VFFSSATTLSVLLASLIVFLSELMVDLFLEFSLSPLKSFIASKIDEATNN
jgi:hypothetical protein